MRDIVGGDDFFMGVMGISTEELAAEVREMAGKFREDVESFYDAVAVDRGSIEACDRKGRIKHLPLITVRSAVLRLPAYRHRFYSPEEVSRIMTGMKKEAKRSPKKSVF